jgi:fructose-1-phosphate kinase PfkB-like protein
MIATVTLNPAVDEFYRVPGFRGGGWFRSGETVRSAGGKGVTMARILKQLGQETLALGFLAGFNGDLLRDCLRREGISTNFVNVPGETRNDVFILNESGHEETMIAEEGPRSARRRCGASSPPMIGRCGGPGMLPWEARSLPGSTRGSTRN